MMRAALLILLLSTLPAMAGIGGHGNALTPFTLGFDGFFVIGSTAGTGQANCGTGTPNNNPGTCWFYVDPTVSGSGGTDPGNNCTNIASPCKYIVSATNQMRAGKPDHLNIKCGTTVPPNNVTDVRVMSLIGKGTSIQAPAVATTFCPGLPEGMGVAPILQAACGFGGFQVTGDAYIGNLTFSNPVRDPASGTFDPTCRTAGGGISRGNGVLNSLVLDGMKFLYFPGNYDIEAAISPQTATNVYFNRSAFYGGWLGNGGYTVGVTGSFIFRENLICHNGWNDSATTALTSVTYNSGTGLVTLNLQFGNGPSISGGPNTVTVSGVTGTGSSNVNGTFSMVSSNAQVITYTISTGLTISGLTGGVVVGAYDGPLAHNLYYQYGPDNVTPGVPFGTQIVGNNQAEVSIPNVWIGNLDCDGTGTDQFRAGSENAQFNAWFRTPGFASLGGRIDNFTDNVFYKLTNMHGGASSAGGVTLGTQNMPFFTTIPTRPQKFSNNIMAWQVPTNSGIAGITETPATVNPNIQGSTLPSTNYDVTNNIICRFPTPIAKLTKGAVLAVDQTTLVAGTGGTPGVYPATIFSNVSPTSGLGSGVTGTIIVGPSGSVTLVDTSSWGSAGATFDSAISGATLTVTNINGGYVIPGNGYWVTGLFLGNNIGSIGRNVISQTSSTDPGGALYKNGVYQLNASTGQTGAPSSWTWTSPQVNGGTGYVIGDTLSVITGSGNGQIPGLTGFSIKVSQVAFNDYTGTQTNTSTCAGFAANSDTTTVENYDTSIGGPGTIDDFIAGALAQSRSDASGKSNWFYKYSAYALVNYFKTGFGQTPNAPVY